MSQSLYSVASLTRCSHTLLAYIRDTPDESSGRIKRYFQDFVSRLISQPSHVQWFGSVQSTSRLSNRDRYSSRAATRSARCNRASVRKDRSILNGTFVRSCLYIPTECAAFGDSSLDRVQLQSPTLRADTEKAQRRNVTSCLARTRLHLFHGALFPSPNEIPECALSPYVEDVTGRGKKGKKKKKKRKESRDRSNKCLLMFPTIPHDY